MTTPKRVGLYLAPPKPTLRVCKFNIIEYLKKRKKWRDNKRRLEELNRLKIRREKDYSISPVNSIKKGLRSTN